MLGIKNDNLPSRWREWHVGDDFRPKGRVVTFQADGHELDMILRAMELAYVDNRSRVVFQDDPENR